MEGEEEREERPHAAHGRYSLATKIIAVIQILFYSGIIIFGGLYLFYNKGQKPGFPPQTGNVERVDSIFYVGVLLLVLIPGILMGIVLLVGAIQGQRVYLNACLVHAALILTFLIIVVIRVFHIFDLIAIIVIAFAMLFVWLSQREMGKAEAEEEERNEDDPLHLQDISGQCQVPSSSRGPGPRNRPVEFYA